MGSSSAENCDEGRSEVVRGGMLHARAEMCGCLASLELLQVWVWSIQLGSPARPVWRVRAATFRSDATDSWLTEL